jgi:serine/threonine protein kinase
MEWIRGGPIGHGSFATVSLAIPTNQTPQLMAVKSCGASHSVSLKNEKLILDEMKDCPQVIQCFGDSFSVEKGERLYNLILEYANGGTISDKLKKTGNFRLPESDVRRYTNSVLKGLDFIHKIGFVHCDIKLQNVLLFEIDGEDTAKIADFGLAKKAGVKIGELGLELRGTPLYMSPEMVTGGEQESPADIWALGCVVSEMITGDSAWRLSKKSDLCGLMMRIGVGQELPEIPGCLSADGKDFLGKCFVKDPKQRWTAEMLLNHPFVTNLEKDHLSVSSKDTTQQTPSISPRSAFDFPDCSTAHSSMTYSPDTSPAARILNLAASRKPNWVISCDEKWIAVR